MKKFSWTMILAGLVESLGGASAEPNVQRMHATGTGFIDCVCSTGPGTRHSWVHEAAVQEGMTLDLTELCWRKRDVRGGGESLCLGSGAYGEDARYYMGTLNEIR